MVLSRTRDYEPAVWKVSHRTFNDAGRKELREKRLIAVHSKTKKGQARAFRVDIQPRDLFCLCHGNDIQLIGKVVSKRAFRRTGWLKEFLLRSYKVIRRRKRELDTGHYDGVLKGWTPNYRSTCEFVPRGELGEFEQRVLQPFFGMNLSDLHIRRRMGTNAERSRRMPANIDQYKKAYSQLIEGGTRIVIPRHKHYQVHLKRFLEGKGLTPSCEGDNIDIQFGLGRKHFIGEIKVTSGYFGLPDPFRMALGQLLDYANLKFQDTPQIPKMIMFLDKDVPIDRARLASRLSIALVVRDKDTYRLLNPKVESALRFVFNNRKVKKPKN